MPFAVRVSVTAVPPSTETWIVPEGTVLPESEVTEIVKESEALTVGAVLVAETDVFEATSVAPLNAGQTPARADRLMVPRPVA